MNEVSQTIFKNRKLGFLDNRLYQLRSDENGAFIRLVPKVFDNSMFGYYYAPPLHLIAEKSAKSVKFAKDFEDLDEEQSLFYLMNRQPLFIREVVNKGSGEILRHESYRKFGDVFICRSTVGGAYALRNAYSGISGKPAEDSVWRPVSEWPEKIRELFEK